MIRQSNSATDQQSQRAPTLRNPRWTQHLYYPKSESGPDPAGQILAAMRWISRSPQRSAKIMGAMPALTPDRRTPARQPSRSRATAASAGVQDPALPAGKQLSRLITSRRAGNDRPAHPHITPSRASRHPRAPTGPRPRQRPPKTLLKTVHFRLSIRHQRRSLVP